MHLNTFIYVIYNMSGPTEKKKDRANANPGNGKPKLPEPKTDRLLRHKKVLFVDDEHANIRFYHALTKAYNDKVQIDFSFASSAEAALETLKSEKFDLLLTDFNMPEKNGLQLATEAKSLYPNLEIVVFSANIYEAVDEAEKLNLDMVVHKKAEFCNPSNFYDYLESVLG